MVAASRQRDLLPLPSFSVNHLLPGSGLTRCVKRRILRKGYSKSWANSAISTINRLGGHQVLASAPPATLEAGSCHALSVISKAFSDMGSPPPEFCGDGSLSEILAKSGVYSDSRPDVQPYDKSRVSWPSAGSVPSALQSVS